MTMSFITTSFMTTSWIHAFCDFVTKTMVITEFELRKLRHDFTELITRAIQPALWLLIFGQVFSHNGAMHTGAIPYIDFIAPGILAQSILFVAIFYGINVIWERDLGIVQRFLASPTPRAALVLGKGFSAGFRTMSQERQTAHACIHRMEARVNATCGSTMIRRVLTLFGKSS